MDDPRLTGDDDGDKYPVKSRARVAVRRMKPLMVVDAKVAETLTKCRGSCLARGSCDITDRLSATVQVTNHRRGLSEIPRGLLGQAAPAAMVHMTRGRQNGVDHTRPDTDWLWPSGWDARYIRTDFI
ncbi:hypothetical protein PC116_g22856 [Phytophthora cactorum]|uniref:Uncharacterized protein n=1 Tax=Phytophthora cactorum TaxID=29920 RepID=A0A8T1K0G0_9STRA|nr:hypothetical protein Pcac1_g25470 [Phytophthora cactorum]KAG2883825.1 hypothetical protein PC114_g20409 [Phytophthora cactorum]KAG2907116.1 hypothetical protein PC117_g20295 [Phytophthora cactorum]KAG2985377.1 hypothetical protein PC119_g20162 [Phytophthora cactorum]KAG3137579.1 hypothetical protein C6341_g20934 [Phytophthora cactorum]